MDMYWIHGLIDGDLAMGQYHRTLVLVLLYSGKITSIVCMREKVMNGFVW